MKKSIMAACLVAAGLTFIGLLSQGCGGGDDSSSGAPGAGEIVLDSKTLTLVAGDGADTTPTAASTNGVVTATVIWSGGSKMTVWLYKDNAIVSAGQDTSPMALSANATPGSTWFVRVLNENAAAFTINMVVSLTP